MKTETKTKTRLENLETCVAIWCVAVFIGVISLLGTGCVVQAQGNQEFGFRQSTSWGFYSETEVSDESQKARSEVSSQPLLDWLASTPADGDPVPASEPAPLPKP